jgi:trimeric autotransporter adhesin
LVHSHDPALIGASRFLQPGFASFSLAGHHLEPLVTTVTVERSFNRLVIANRIGAGLQWVAFNKVMKNLAGLSSLSVCFGASIALTACGGGSGSSTSTQPQAQPPVVTSISPAKVTAGAANTTLTVSGSNFTPNTVVQVGPTIEPTTFVGTGQLTALLPASQLAEGNTLSVIAVNGSLSSATGAPVSLEVDNPAPTLTLLSPPTALVGSTPASIAVSGTGFTPTTVINVNGAARITDYVSGIQVNFVPSAGDLGATGSLSVTAVNPTPGGGTSAAATLGVSNPTVGTLQLTPSSVNTGGSSPVTVTIKGATFVSGSVVQVNGTTRASTFVDANTLTFALTVAEQAKAAIFSITVTNPAPGGGVSPAAGLSVVVPPPTPVITSVNPASILAGSSDTQISVSGTGFDPTAIVEWNGTPLVTTYAYGFSGVFLLATVPAADLTTAGTASVTVKSPTANPPLSNASPVTITNPPAPTLTSINPSGGPINTTASITLNGTGFTAQSTVLINGVSVATTFDNSSQLTATVPAPNVALPGNVNVAVTTPAPGGGTSAALQYTVYIAIANNDIVYNPADGLLYASVPNIGVGTGGNDVEGIDPLTGAVKRQIWVGTGPDKLALSSDGTQLFVGIDGAGAVAQVDLSQGKVVDQFSLGGGPGIYNPPYTAQYLAAVPGSPSSVAVATQGGFFGGNGVTIYDSGVARANPSSGISPGPLAFGTSASTLYELNGSTVEKLTVDATGITATTALATVTNQVTWVQYDNGRLYLSSGQVFDSSSGALLGTFYSSPTAAATGPIVSDSMLGRAFVANTSFSSTGQVMAFDESSFNTIGNITVNQVGTQGYPSNFQKIVRWGQNGLAVSATPSAFTSINQIFIFQSPLVQDLSASPADLSVVLTAPAATTTGSAGNWVATITNNGPNQSNDVALTLNMDPSLIANSVTPSSGSCAMGSSTVCNLGNVANGAVVTVTVNATPTNAGTFTATATISSVSYDPTLGNNQSNTNSVVTGSLYGAVPFISGISPNFVQAGAADFTLTVNGAGFNNTSIVDLGTTPLTTTYVSSSQLTATVPAAQIANYGWAAITVNNPAPGGGTSALAPLTIYAIVNVPANSILFDPYSQLLYATVPSTATTLTGDSVVTIDPVTATIGTPVAVGSQPTVMTESNDGNYLYISLIGSDSLAQFDPVHQQLLETISLASASSRVGTNTANWLSVMPGSDSTLAVSYSGTDGILDISANTGTFRTNFAYGSSPVFGDASHLFADNGGINRYSIDATGATLLDSTTVDGIGNNGSSIQLAGGLIYGAGGGIVNPFTTPPSQVATLPPFDFYNSGINGSGVSNVADPSLGKEFIMMENTAGIWAYGLARYDLTTDTPEDVVGMPQSASGILSTWSLLRWGQDGLALLSVGQNIGNGQPAPVLMLVRGPFVAPQLLATHSAATLTSSSTSTITHGSGNILLTLTGSNFLPGVAVTWNGTYRTTTIVDSSHVTLAIPASDLVSAGTASLVATNPGADASSALTITIN